MKFEIQERAKEIISKIEELLSSTPTTMKSIVEKRPSAHGIYAISDENDEAIIYVGMTKTAGGGVGQRLSDHLNMTGKTAKTILRTFMSGDKVAAGKCLVRILEVENRTERRNIESVAIGILSPKFNKP